MRPLILASSSPYRRALLLQLQLPFQCASPHINEEAFPNELPDAMATRLATEKAAALQGRYPDALIIGSDQVAECAGHTLGKPGDAAGAKSQLKLSSGKAVSFHTGLCVLDASSGEQLTACEIYRVYFRQLSDPEIARYIELEEPFDCAGSFKAEGLGVRLFEKMEGSDPNSLIGLPLIRLIDMLKKFGVDPLLPQH